VPFGAILERCVIPGTVALTFDDGPFVYTSDLLELLSAYGARSTFFLNGQNKGSFHGDAAVVRRIFEEGHQIGSHTYVSPGSIIHCRSSQLCLAGAILTSPHWTIPPLSRR
jgi:peptidoglycan/xylan/chitin deacetylase (PgdA/CDA1 family)